MEVYIRCDKKYFPKHNGWAKIQRYLAQQGVWTAHNLVSNWAHLKKRPTRQKKTMEIVKLLIPICEIHPYRFIIKDDEIKMIKESGTPDAHIDTCVGELFDLLYKQAK